MTVYTIRLFIVVALLTTGAAGAQDSTEQSPTSPSAFSADKTLADNTVSADRFNEPATPARVSADAPAPRATATRIELKIYPSF